jgi:hypothetical protein
VVRFTDGTFEPATFEPHSLVLLAIPIRVGDEVDAAVGLALPSAVIGRRGGEALGEKRAGELRAAILQVQEIVSEGSLIRRRFPAPFH